MKLEHVYTMISCEKLQKTYLGNLFSHLRTLCSFAIYCIIMVSGQTKGQARQATACGANL
jgi:hypothetical protein